MEKVEKNVRFSCSAEEWKVLEQASKQIGLRVCNFSKMSAIQRARQGLNQE